MVVTHVVSVIYILICVKEGRLLPEVLLGKRGIDSGEKRLEEEFRCFQADPPTDRVLAEFLLDAMQRVVDEKPWLL